MLIVWLALRDLLRDRLFLVCNVAVMVGILVPLLLLFGVKNGIYSVLIEEMLSDPANLQIDTTGNITLTEAQIAPLGDWPEIAFLTPKVRGQFDYVNVRAEDGRRLVAALLVPSGAGDPTLPRGADVTSENFAVSARLAQDLGLSAGADIQLVSQAEDRPRQLVLRGRVGLVLTETALAGRAVLAPYSLLETVEAFYDAYALPEYGIEGEKFIADRPRTFAGLRVYARRLEELAPLQARIEDHLDVATTARVQDVSALLGLGRKLTLALGLTAGLATLGLGAALVLAFWADVARKRVALAGLSMLGVPARALALIPVVQAVATAGSGLALSFILYGVAAPIAGRVFGGGLPQGARLTLISPLQAAAISAVVLVLVVSAAALAARRAMRLDPATVLREVI